ncbi:MAG: CNP1-like family protein [Pseudomonadota bacterium]|nr:CNP1-like family protein [Pseudomonadota bacterium]
MKTLIFVLLSIIPMTLQAAESDPVYGDVEQEQHIPRKGENKPPAKLTIDGMPEYPGDSNLRKLEIRRSKSTYYVDISSITSSKKDNIVHVVTVGISPYGARTVAYEGFDCGYKRYRAYGYAGSEGPVRPFDEQTWRPVKDEGEGRYRALLIDSYLCGYFAYAASREKILNRMNSLKSYDNQD